ncbi:mechanosensitive ion channel family protein [Crocosphaera watsonii]|uniref:Small-conductance mechanosensitive channel n=2 Tax=Crocosphaera watsonii TaxID=263511 RepID=T2JS94_CROWT|nr:mechanosensitive ion channel domain-containing protein [Crocosphaera watsonii]CCQ67906.1 Small-conductance mechanosensitive channel [Crocosphaera watsonii WH 0402]
MMYRLKKRFAPQLSSTFSLKLCIIISLLTCFLLVTLSSVTQAQNPVIAPSPNLEETEEVVPSKKVYPSDPNLEETEEVPPTPSLSPTNNQENSQLKEAAKDPEIQELMKRFNVGVQEAIKLRDKKNELDTLGLFSLSSGQLGNLQYQAIKLDGRIVMPVAANLEDDKNILRVRVKTIENTLDEIVKRNINPDDIKIFPSILNQETVLVISPKNQSGIADIQVRQKWLLMTITAADSRLYGIPIPVLATISSHIVHEALEVSWKARQPHSILQQGVISFGILILMIIASWLLLASQKYVLPGKKHKKSMFWNRRLLLIGHAIIWFPGMGFILRGFPDSYEIGFWLLENTFTISIAIISFLLISRILDLIVKFGEAQERLKIVPVRVFVQLFYILVASLFILIIIANSINQPLTNILATVGAGSAILMLIFKDSIMGFTAGLQLAANRMVALGDWIEMPKYGADGFINEVNLFTVKVLNWDNTITSIPTYALISDSFKNWRVMFESGVRKIQRAVYIDMTSIKFCDQEMLEKFSTMKYIGEDIKQHLSNNNLEPTDEKFLTNIGVFRAYVMAYLHAHPKVSPGPYFLVRQLHPTAHGLPIEIYVYSNDTAWAHYEEIQSGIFDHILCVIPQFDLRVFQSPSSYDLGTLRMRDKLIENSSDLSMDNY